MVKNGLGVLVGVGCFNSFGLGSPKGWIAPRLDSHGCLKIGLLMGAPKHFFKSNTESLGHTFRHGLDMDKKHLCRLVCMYYFQSGMCLQKMVGQLPIEDEFAVLGFGPCVATFHIFNLGCAFSGKSYQKMNIFSPMRIAV